VAENKAARDGLSVYNGFHNLPKPVQSIEHIQLLSLTASFSFLSEIKHGTTLTKLYTLLALLDLGYTVLVEN